MTVIEQGNAYCHSREDGSVLLDWVWEQSKDERQHVLLISRLPHNRLLEHLDLSKVESYWLSEKLVANSIEPSLEKISHLVKSRVANHHGTVVIEGMEWLFSKHGIERCLGFVRMICDAIHRRPWSVLFAIQPGAIPDTAMVRLQREAPEINLKKFEEEIVATKEPETIADDITEESKSSGLVMLTRLSINGFSHSVLRKRLLQWRRMGLDVSELEPGLFIDDMNECYALYQQVEHKVRRAVELDSRLEIIAADVSTAELVKMRFRIRQLTGLDDVEQSIELHLEQINL